MNTDPNYILGHSDFELDRLRLQGEMLEKITRSLLRNSGIGTGMRVLDIGCGIGDVSMLLAEVVGPTGFVLAIDREPRAIEMARTRASAAGHRQINFAVTSEEFLPEGPPFDAAVGRYVLIHQTDPAAMVRRAVAAVRSGGIIAFQEPALYIMGHAFPEVPLFRDMIDCLIVAFRNQLANHDVAGRMTKLFGDADLFDQNVSWESIVGQASSPLLRWNLMTFVSMKPYIERLQIRRPVVDLERLEEDVTAAILAAGSQIISTPQCCAWAKRI